MSKVSATESKGRILLINPWIYDFAAYDLWAEPLGLLYIGAMLRAYGYEVTLIDCLDRSNPGLLRRQGRDRPKSNRFGCGKYHKVFLEKPALLAHVPRRYGRYGIPLDTFEAELDRAGRPDAVLITSGMTYWYPGAWLALAKVKGRFPGTPTVLGGIYATLCYQHALRSGADYVLPGASEREALELVDRLTGNPTESLALSLLLDDYPYPAHDLRYVPEYASILTSRGCPYRCTYCASHLLHQGLVQRAPTRVVDEIEHFHHRCGIVDFAFYDDALLMHPETHIAPILDEIARRGLRCRFHSPNGLHARFITPWLAEKIRRAGFEGIRLGLETVSAERQRETGGKVGSEHVRAATRALRGVGFSSEQIGVYILVGLPGQPAEEVELSIDFAHECGTLVKLALWSPIPGTVEWRRAAVRGLLDPEADPLLHNNSIYPLHGSVEGYAELRKLKDQAREANENLLSGARVDRANPPGGEEAL